jgi:RimJ/RimL family protein N-acetyltransferase
MDSFVGSVDWRQNDRPGPGVWDIAAQHALERAGFLREGCARGAHFRDGQSRDSYIHGITRNDWRHST